jgi:predicted 3-demethylubiquinone-9 3-methyltransferase (glyoxalase superfamily)
MLLLRSAFVLCALAFLGGLASAQDKTHPFAKAKVGDWVAYKVDTGSQSANIAIKQTVSARDAEGVILKVEMSMGGKPLQATDQRVSLKEPFDPARMLQSPTVKSQITKLGEGDETLTVGGKKYKCTWVKNRVITEFNGQIIETNSKIWISKDVPLGGLVRAETETAGATTMMELTGVGSR